MNIESANPSSAPRPQPRSGAPAPGTRNPTPDAAPWALTLLTAAALLVVGCTGSTVETAATPAPPPEVPIRRVVEQSIPDRLEFTGHTASAHSVELRARVGGYVVEVPYAEGQFVEAGSVLFEIDPRPFTAALAVADAEVTRARAAAELARRELDRAEQLARKEAIAAEELQRRRTDLETATATLASAVGRRDVAALNVEFTRVKAPVSGLVSRALVKPGNLVSGGEVNATLLATLVTVDPLHVLFNVDEPAHRRLALLRTSGQPLRAEVRLGDRQEAIEGIVDYIAPALDPRSGTGQARVVVTNAARGLAPGLFARVTVSATSDEPRVLVPETALGAFQGSRHVLVVGPDNTLVQRSVQLGERHGSDRVVTRGLSSGEAIVVAGLQRVRPGMTVRPVEAGLASN